MKYAVAGPDLVKILEHFILTPGDDSVTSHHDATESFLFLKTFSSEVDSSYNTVKAHGNRFLDKTDKYKHLINGVVIEDLEASKEVFESYERGQLQQKNG